MKHVNKVLLTLLLFPILLSCTTSKKSDQSTSPFSWDNATVYFVYIDRFNNADTSNDHNYNRKNDYGSTLKNVATFHGGDIKGLTEKLKDNYFKNLGINVLWVTGVYEQIHGWVGGGDKNDFPHYAYHGYYPMDFTMMDKNYGTIEEFRAFVDLAHEQGIRVVMDAGINHPGYATLLDAVQYQFGGVTLTEAQAREHIEGLSRLEDQDAAHYQVYAYLQNFDFDCIECWENWWGYSWMRKPDEVDKDILTESIFGLPDFRTESRDTVGLPAILKNKWKQEGEDFSAWINPSAIPFRRDLKQAQTDYVIQWLAAWVEEFGIDGFRCDVLENVDTHRWAQLKKECDEALINWRINNPDQAAAHWEDDFWMTGDIWDAGIEYYEEYAEAGFNSIVNFTFPKDGDLHTIGETWQVYADQLNSNDNWSTLSFLNNTYKREADFGNMKDCGTSLLLAPGAVQIFYGDEVARQEVKTEATDPTHGYRSDFNWDYDLSMLAHWQKLGKFRNRQLAIGAGSQELLNDSTFVRRYEREGMHDTVIIAFTEQVEKELDVSGIFSDGQDLVNAYDNESATVKNGIAVFHPTEGILLVEQKQR